MRNDFFQLLIEQRKSENNNEWKSGTMDKKETLEELAGEAFTFFLGGYESTAVAISFCLYSIAKHPDIQQKVHAEIDRVLAQNNGELSYDSINELKYLECCFDGLY